MHSSNYFPLRESRNAEKRILEGLDAQYLTEVSGSVQADHRMNLHPCNSTEFVAENCCCSAHEQRRDRRVQNFVKICTSAVFWALVWGTRSTSWIAASKAFHQAISTCNSRRESKPEFSLKRYKSTTIPVYAILLPAVVDIGSAHKNP